jgi:hypothetical protein
MARRTASTAALRRDVAGNCYNGSMDRRHFTFPLPIYRMSMYSARRRASTINLGYRLLGRRRIPWAPRLGGRLSLMFSHFGELVS